VLTAKTAAAVAAKVRLVMMIISLNGEATRSCRCCPSTHAAEGAISGGGHALVRIKGAPRSLAAPVVPRRGGLLHHLAALGGAFAGIGGFRPALALQAFWPLQAELADLQALVPLQALAPLHLVVWAWAAVASVPAAKERRQSPREYAWS